MNEREFLNLLHTALDEGLAQVPGDYEEAIRSIRTFEEVGVLSGNVGMVVRMLDGSEFQITVVQSAGWPDEDDYDEDNH